MFIWFLWGEMKRYRLSCANMTSRQRWFIVLVHTGKKVQVCICWPFLGGGNLHTPWSCCIVGGSKSQVHRPGSITGPSSIVQGPMSRAAAEVVATEQTAAATEETAEEVIDEVLATAGAEVADLLASKGVTISPAILTLGADVVFSSTRLLALMACQIFPNIFSSSFWMLDHDHFFGFVLKLLTSHPRSLQIFKSTYETSTNFTWAFGGFSTMRSSFFPTGVRTTDDVGRLCGSSLFFTWLFFSLKQ